MIIEEYNPSESKYYTFIVYENEKSIREYRRIEMDKLMLLIDTDEVYSNKYINECEKFQAMSDDDLIKNSEVYAYFADSKTLYYKMPMQFITKDIVFEGYTSFPKHFYKSGGGLTDFTCTTALTNGLNYFIGDNKHKIEEFYITKNGETSIKKMKNRGYRLRINEKDFEKIFSLAVMGKNEGKILSNNSIAEFFHNRFPRYSRYNEKRNNNSKLKKIFLSTLDKSLIGKFNAEELEMIEAFYQELLGENKKKKEFVRRNLLKIKEISLDSILKEFDEYLKKKTKEQTWQNFFEKNIFIFDSRYIDFISKFNLKVGRKAEPDFLVYDIYGFVDIYEIKKPDTKLLRYDESHDNYYWSPDASKSIAQLEKYISIANENRLEIEKSIKGEKEQSVSIIKPKGILVIGSRGELCNDKMKEDFAILRKSLKNIEIVLYDEMFESLKNLKKVSASSNKDV